MKRLLFIMVLAIVSTVSFAQSKEDIEAVSHYDVLIWPTKITGEGNLEYCFAEIAKILRGVNKEIYSDQQIDELTYSQKKKALLIHISASQSDRESVLSVDFRDYFSEIPVASVRGKFGNGWSRDGDMKGAIKRLRKNMYKLFNVTE